jgi:hypothetical protein
VVVVILTAATVAASCRDPASTSVSRGSPDAATTLPTAAARGALDERCLVGTDAPNLSTLAGTSSGTVGATLRTKTQDQAPAPQNRGFLGGALPTTNSRSTVSSSARAREWPPRRLSPPPLRSPKPSRRSPKPSRRSPVPLRCARPPLLTAWRQVSLRPLRALAPLPPLRPSATGVGDSISRGGELAPHRSNPSPSTTTTNSLGSPGERAPAAHAVGTPRSVAPGAPTAGSSSPSCVCVNTKNWYRKGTDLWAEFGKEAPFGRKISSKDSVKIFAVGSTPSFGKRTVCA